MDPLIAMAVVVACVSGAMICNFVVLHKLKHAGVMADHPLVRWRFVFWLGWGSAVRAHLVPLMIVWSLLYTGALVAIFYCRPWTAVP